MKGTAIVYFLIGIIALGMGIYMLFDDAMLNQLGPTIRFMFIGLLLAYGAFRLYTAMKGLRKPSVTQ